MIKAKIPKALREQIWLRHIGKKYEGKCRTTWCENTLTVFDFQCGHDIPESKGGATTIENLVPICARCNLSMSNTYTFKEWNQLSKPVSVWRRLLKFFRIKRSDIKESGTKLPLKIMNQKDKHIK